MKQFTCPCISTVQSDKGKFASVNGWPHWIVTETLSQPQPCRGTSFKIVDRHPFKDSSGFDIGAVLVKCNDCNQESYVFPTPRGKFARALAGWG
jgi:hypothetical protein